MATAGADAGAGAASTSSACMEGAEGVAELAGVLLGQFDGSTRRSRPKVTFGEASDPVGGHRPASHAQSVPRSRVSPNLIAHVLVKCAATRACKL